MATIPVIDLAPYSLSVPADDVDSQVLQTIADELYQAFTTVGFVYFKNHGIPQNIIEKTYAESKKFFDKPVEVKEKYAKPDDAIYGWGCPEKESLNPDQAADLKEFFHMTDVNEPLCMPRDILPDFYVAFRNMYTSAQELANRVLGLLAVGLNLDPSFFRNCHKKMGKGGLTTLRSLYYPPITKEVKPGQLRCGEHSDYGSITLLFQDDVGGLEVKPVGCEYIPATPVPGTVLVNLGDLMQRWSADKLIATKHRVVIPDEEKLLGKGRQSMAFFLYPDEETVIKCLDNSGKYDEISALDYLNMRFATTNFY